MKRSIVCAVVLSSILSAFVFTLPSEAARNPGNHARSSAFGRLPLSFEANKGQTDSRVKFLSHGNGYTLFLTGDEAVLKLAPRAKPSSKAQSGAPHNHALKTNLAPEVIRMKLLGANVSSTVAGGDELPGKSNYFIGNDPRNWRTGVDTFAKVKYVNIYAGIDLVYYGNQGQLENDFVLAPGADPKKIQISLAGQAHPGNSTNESVRVLLDAKGDLTIHSGDSAVTLRKPVAYQLDEHGTKHFVNSEYAIQAADAKSGANISFRVSGYDRSKALVIDPTLAYSSYLGGTGLNGGATVEIAVDSSGSAYLAGPTLSTDYPTTPGAIQPSFGGAGAPDCSNTASDCGDAVLTKINSSGTAIIYSTYLGGSNGDTAYGLAVDSGGNAYLAGSTQSSNFPTTAGAFQTNLNIGLGQIVCDANNNPYGRTGTCADLFIAKIDPTGSRLIYSTLLGGSGSEQSQGIAVDRFGDAYITGATDSTDFPTTAGAFQASEPCSGPPCQNAFVSKLSADGSQLVYSTYLGNGSSGAFAIALDSAGEAYVDGWITGVTPLNFPTTPSAFQAQQNIPAAGCDTFQPNFSFHCYDGFLTKLDATGSSLLYSTIFGGTGNEFLNGVAVDAQGDAYITGFTNSPDFPVTPGAFQTIFPGTICQASSFFGANCPDVFVAKFDPSKSGAASLVYSTFLGGSGNQGANDVVVDSSGNAYISGGTSSLDFPLVDPIQNALADGIDCNNTSSFFSGSCSDAFVAELNATGSALIFSTYLGGSKSDYSDFLAIDSFDNIYVAGNTVSSDFPTTPGVFQPNFTGTGDFFIAKISPITVEGLGEPLAALVTVGSPVPLPAHAFKQGSTLPLKLQLFHGTKVLTGATTAPPQITAIVRNGSPIDFATIDLDSGQANDNGSFFRNSGSGWIFNLSTKGLSTGSYTLTITVAGTPYEAAFVLR